MKRMRILTLFMAAALLAFSCGCSLFGGQEEESSSASESSEEEEIDPEYPVTAAGITLTGRPGKVVSLSPSLTEKLYDLGMEDSLAGISDYCDYPDTVLGLPACGTAQLPDLDEIEKIAPHLVLSEGALSDEAMAALDELDIPVAIVPRADSVDSLMNNYLDLARLLEGEQAGGAMGQVFTESYLARLESLRNALSGYTEENGRKKILYLRLLDFTVATGDTFEQQLFDYACLDNIAAAQTDWLYPEEAAKAADGQADFVATDIIYMDDAFVTITMLEQSAFYKGLPAVLKDQYMYISSIALERQSMRTVFMLEDMAAYAYPEADLAAGAAAGDPEADDGGEAEGEAGDETEAEPDGEADE